MDFNLQPILESEKIRLRPLQQSDFESMYAVAADPLIWEQHQNKDRHTFENFTNFFNEAMTSKGALAIVDIETDKIIGSSRFKLNDTENGVVEIGWSFLSRSYWGGHYNWEFKKLMVNHALKQCKYVIFYVNNMNTRSQRAMEKLGARRVEDVTKPWVVSKERGVTYVIDAPL